MASEYSMLQFRSIFFFFFLKNWDPRTKNQLPTSTQVDKNFMKNLWTMLILLKIQNTETKNKIKERKEKEKLPNSY